MNFWRDLAVRVGGVSRPAVGGAVVLIGLMAGVGRLAADALPDATELQPDAAENANKYLGSVWKNDAAGLKLAPPVGSTVGSRAGLELMDFVQEQKQWGGDLKVILLKEKMTVAEYVNATVAQLGKSYKGMQVLESRQQKFAKYDAARLTTTMEADVAIGTGGSKAAVEHVVAYRQQMIVHLSDLQYLVLTFYAPIKDRAEATKTFDAMLQSFEIQDRTKLAERRLAAITLGKQWLARQSAEELKSKLIGEPQLFRMKIAGKDIGYLRFDELEVEQDGTRGVRIGVSSRAWLGDGSVVSGQNTAYWAYSHDEKTHQPRPGYSCWENRSQRVATVPVIHPVPNSPRTEKYAFWMRESGILTDQGLEHLDPATLDALRKEREELIKRSGQAPPPIEPVQKQQHLIVSCTADERTALNEQGKGVDVMIPEYRQAVLPKILEYCWPRLVDLSKPTEMMFAVYNSGSRKMTLRTLCVVGPDKIILQHKLVDCVRCTDEMDDSGTTIWVDSTGRILKMLTSDQSLLEPTTVGTMEELWGKRLGLFDKPADQH